VFDQPASPFVMNFLGNVNIFHGRVESARPCWPLAIDYPEHPHGESLPPPATLDRTTSRCLGSRRANGLWHGEAVNAAGPLVRLELTDGDGTGSRSPVRPQHEHSWPVRGTALRRTQKSASSLEKPGSERLGI